MPTDDSSDHLRIWQRAVIAALWLISPALMGFLAAIISGEHGSVVFVVVGLYVGVSGALSYLLFPLFPPFRRLGARFTAWHCYFKASAVFSGSCLQSSTRKTTHTSSSTL
jgi:hypothetical protein